MDDNPFEINVPIESTEQKEKPKDKIGALTNDEKAPAEKAEDHEEDMWAEMDMDNKPMEIKAPIESIEQKDEIKNELGALAEEENALAKKADGKEEKNRAHEETTLYNVDGRELFPTFQWRQKEEEGSNWFSAATPPETVYEGSNNLWRYSPSLYDAIVWYWKTIKWDMKNDGQITWAQIALDFQAATHEDLARENKDPEEETLAKRAATMKAASAKIEQLFNEETVPGGVKGHLNSGALQPMGYFRATGIAVTPILMKKRQVDSILLDRAVQAKLNSISPTLNFVPDLGQIGQPLWRHGYEQSQRRRLRGKQAPKQVHRRPRNLKVKTAVILKHVKWTEEEKKSIDRAKSRVERQREEKRHLHNRARQDDTHRLASLIGMTHMACERCGKRCNLSYLSAWPNTKCRKVPCNT